MQIVKMDGNLPDTQENRYHYLWMESDKKPTIEKCVERTLIRG